jgi:hypothetical protein
VYHARLICTRSHWSCILYTDIPQMTMSWFSISQTVKTNDLVDHIGFPLCAVTNWSPGSLCIPAVHYIVSWLPQYRFTYITSHGASYCCCFQQVNTKYNGQSTSKEQLTTSGKPIQPIDTVIDTMISWCEWWHEWLGSWKGPSPLSIAQCIC